MSLNDVCRNSIVLVHFQHSTMSGTGMSTQLSSAKSNDSATADSAEGVRLPGEKYNSRGVSSSRRGDRAEETTSIHPDPGSEFAEGMRGVEVVERVTTSQQVVDKTGLGNPVQTNSNLNDASSYLGNATYAGYQRLGSRLPGTSENWTLSSVDLLAAEAFSFRKMCLFYRFSPRSLMMASHGYWLELEADIQVISAVTTWSPPQPPNATSDLAIRAASAVLAGPAFFPGKRSNQPHFGRRSNGIPLAIAVRHAWTKRRLRRLLGHRHTSYPPVSRLLFSDYRLLNVYGVMWPRRPGFFFRKNIILASNLESSRPHIGLQTRRLVRVAFRLHCGTQARAGFDSPRVKSAADGDLDL
ncbi:hypothetical protein BDZ89DRAFT_1041344 [Hymenopellis radicata]|nr:hypothetical protein BDZ89DRAFT_1041344 [Hymenopellis radicata]